MSAIAQTLTGAAVLNLDALRQMTYAELDGFYRSARCPSAISELNGDTRGAMLAWRSPRTGPIAWWFRGRPRPCSSFGEEPQIDTDTTD